MIPLLQLDWLRIAKVALPMLAAIVLVAMLASTRSLLATTRTERDAAVADVAEFRQMVAEATLPPDAVGARPMLSSADAKAALRGLGRDRDDARAALAMIDQEARAARARSAASDAELARAQAENLKRFERAAPMIARLEAAGPTGSVAADAAAIDDDSKAAWEAWR